MSKKQQSWTFNVPLSCFHYREGKYTCRCPLWARKPILPYKQLCNVTMSCWWSCYCYKEVLCGGHLHLWLGFDKDRGILDVGRKDGKSFCHFITLKVKLKNIWSVFGENMVSDIQWVFPHRPEGITIHRNKTSRSGVGPDLWSFLPFHARSHYTLHRAMRLKITLIGEQRPGCGWA